MLLSWKAVAGASSYNIYRCNNHGDRIVPATASLCQPKGATNTDTGPLAGGTAYYYTVAAVNASGSSRPSPSLGHHHSVRPHPVWPWRRQRPDRPELDAGHGEPSATPFCAGRPAAAR